MAANHSDPSLYQRLGGYDVIARVIDDLFGLMRTDPRFSRFGAGRSLDSHQRARQLTVDMICHLAGGPCVYIGRDMKASHAGLGITEQEWEVNLQYTRQALIKNGIAEKEQGEFLALFERYREEIVENKATAQHS
ncbi:MAG TPA: group 1 truncated hemoglobin [Terriglobales bacterium]|nr:group 1 truncated hemoglobin [Terriglobales bacterium]